MSVSRPYREFFKNLNSSSIFSDFLFLAGFSTGSYIALNRNNKLKNLKYDIETEKERNIQLKFENKKLMNEFLKLKNKN